MPTNNQDLVLFFLYAYRATGFFQYTLLSPWYSVCIMQVVIIVVKTYHFYSFSLLTQPPDVHSNTPSLSCELVDRQVFVCLHVLWCCTYLFTSIIIRKSLSSVCTIQIIRLFKTSVSVAVWCFTAAWTWMCQHAKACAITYRWQEHHFCSGKVCYPFSAEWRYVLLSKIYENPYIT